MTLPGATLFANGHPYVAVDDLRAAVRRLDDDVSAAAERIQERQLHDEFSDRPHTTAEQLGHMAEEARHVARHVDEWLDGRRLVVGRPPEGDADLHDGLLRASTADLDTLRRDLAESIAELDVALSRLRGEHLTVAVHHVARGREPLASFLTRSLLQHRQSHLQELLFTLRDLEEGRP